MRQTIEEKKKIYQQKKEHSNNNKHQFVYLKLLKQLEEVTKKCKLYDESTIQTMQKI